MLEQVLKAVRAAAWVSGLAYPLALYWALTRYGAAGGAWVGVASAVLWALRAGLGPAGDRSLWLLPLLLLGLSGLSLWVEEQRVLLALPVAINGALLVTFTASLFGEQTYVERIARLRDPELSPDKVRHCRQFTWIWIAFFVCNGLATATLAWAGWIEAWALYTSFLSYVLIALLLVTEWVVRRWRFGPRAEPPPPGEISPSGELSPPGEISS